MNRINFTTLTPQEFIAARECLDGRYLVPGAFIEIIDQEGLYWGSVRVAKTWTGEVVTIPVSITDGRDVEPAPAGGN